MLSLSWSKVNAWRLSQHSLLQRAERQQQQLLDVVTRIGGVHAQLMSSAELALWARVEGLSQDDVRNALWQDRTLLKTWAMRGTLHLLTASEFSWYVAARSAHTIRRPPSYFTYHGVTPAEYEAIVETVPQVLSDKPMTREQLADAIAKQARKPKLRDVLLSGWGALLKPSAFRGDLCFGPNQGQNVTFVHPARWIGEWRSPAPQQALQEIARRYLNAYGPASADDFARWWGIDAGPAKKLFRALAQEIEPVEVEGRQVYVLSHTLDKLKALKAARSIRLLPQFDAYVVGLSRDDTQLLPAAQKARVFRPQGWISAVVLVDGRVAGVWELSQQGSHSTANVELFESPTPVLRRGIQAEVRRLGEFLHTEISVNVASV
jgi:hypothetical protein